MKILHVIGSVDPRNGGTTDHVFSSSEVWLRHGHESHIVCLDPPDAPWVTKSPVRTFALGPNSRLGRELLGQDRFRYGFAPRLITWLRQNAPRYDAVLLNGLWNFTSFGSWIALRNSNVPYFICPHGMLDPWLKESYPIKHFLKKCFWRLFERRVVRDARALFFACEEEKQLAGYFLGPALKRRCHVVSYGTKDILGDADQQKIAFLNKFPNLEGRKLILFLSRIHPKKGLDLLIRAFADHATELSEFDLVIAGPDALGLTTRLSKNAMDLGIDQRIHWTGMLVGDTKWGAYRSAEFFVLPSHQENFGIAVVEAMALSVPVLITNKVNIWRVVQTAGAGHVVADEVDKVAAGIIFMCTRSGSQLRLMGQAARSCFLDHFNLERNAMELLYSIQTALK